ncbi:putative mitochondrial [Leptomonas pyrrhocoris]|uniref:Putative mitochondrial n=1 Tax=Leptomonas pyrrhocoris TaxID=157538 RepID=A0A0M9G3W6_LEPPY|nr:putative mitochondrial [Leptomonas pyrrhocoris]KPA81723.1 putative mitochondrial [Leptomonas pyrrhocoris]|eukprot:XP_015660162.1 putative mitochondrial [Leptomonas pyrrhocoris]
MLRFVPRRLAIGAYTLFMMEQKNNPKLKGLRIAERGKMTSKLYKSLSPADKASLEKRAAAHPSLQRKDKAPKAAKAAKGAKTGAARTPSEYAKFVQANIGRFDKLPHLDRMKAVAKLWKQQQTRTGK